MSMKNQASRDSSRSQDSIRILMADDDPQEHLLMVMAAEGCSTPLVFDFVPEGGALLTELYVPTSVRDLPNAIILDLRMPGLNGHRTLTELQRHPMFWQIPVVVFTSSAKRKDEELSYERGAVLFETKPATLSEMDAFLERVVEVAKPTDEYIGEAIIEPVTDLTEGAADYDLLDLTRSRSERR